LISFSLLRAALRSTCFSNQTKLTGLRFAVNWDFTPQLCSRIRICKSFVIPT
jgi:hypothetical protein